MPIIDKSKIEDTLIEFGSDFTITTKADVGSQPNELIIEGFASTSDKDRAWDIIPGTAWADPDARKNYLMNPIVLA